MKCRICDNESGNVAYTGVEMMFGTCHLFAYVRCAACGCLQIRDYPADLAEYYGAHYYSFHRDALEERGFKRFRTDRRNRYAVDGRGRLGRYFHEREPNLQLSNLSSVLGDRRRRILDVGCGSASLLRSLDRIGFHDVVGADPFIDAEIRFGRRGRVLKKTLAEVDGPFDVIMFHHSFEHLPHQHEVLAQVRTRLAPGGTCVLALPLSSSYAWEHYGIDWVQLDAPRHFYLHTVDSLGRLASAAGLTIVRTIFDSTAFQFWGSEQYRSGVPLFDDRSLTRRSIDGSMFTREDMAGFARRAVELNADGRGDQAMFFLQLSA